MKISKLFHWLYAILMFLPFGLVIFNLLHGLFSPSATGLLSLTDWYDMLYDCLSWFINFSGGNTLFVSINNVYDYLVHTMFGLESEFIGLLLSYWTSISIIWLVFDVFMYVPLLVHRWIDKAKLE